MDLIDSIPADLLRTCLTYLHGDQVCNMESVNSSWRDMILDEEAAGLWMQLAEQDYGKLQLEKNNEATLENAKRYFRECFVVGEAKKGLWRRVKKTETSPPELQGTAGDAAGRYFVIFGGWTNGNPFLISEMFALDTISNKWFNVSVHGKRPRRCYGHTISHSWTNTGVDCMVLYGGLHSGGYRGEMNDLYMLYARDETKCLEEVMHESDSLKWTKPRTSGTIPAARAYHTCTYVPPTRSSPDNRIAVFGGFNTHGAISNLEILNVDSLEWSSEVPDGTEPPGRFGHSAVVVGNKLFISGGCTGGNNHKGAYTSGQELYDVHILDLNPDNFCWSTPDMPELFSFRYCFRRCHSGVAVGENILFFGGGPSNRLNDEVACLDTRTMRMRTVATVQNQTPQPRQNHAACFIGNKMFVFGGWNGFELDETLYLDLNFGEGELAKMKSEESRIEDISVDVPMIQYRDGHFQQLEAQYRSIQQLLEMHGVLQHSDDESHDVECVHQ